MSAREGVKATCSSVGPHCCYTSQGGKHLAADTDLAHSSCTDHCCHTTATVLIIARLAHRCYTGRDIYAPDPPARRAFGKALAFLLPASMAGVLAWGFLNPDDQAMFTATSPRQVPVSGEEVVNWSATHSVKPK